MSHLHNKQSSSRHAKRVGLNTSVPNALPAPAEVKHSSVEPHKGQIHLKSHAQRLFNRLEHDARATVPQLRRRSDSRKSVSDKTRQIRLDYVLRLLRILLQEGYQLKSLNELGERHIARGMSWMRQSGCSRKYMVCMFVQLRHFMEHGLKKQGALKDMEHYVGVGVISRMNATFSRAVSSQVDADGNRLDPVEFIKRAHEHDVRAGLTCELAYYMGLRRNEALSIQPHKCELVNDKIFVRSVNAKNGRARNDDLKLVPEFRERAKALIERMKALCPKEDDTLYQGVSLRVAQESLRKSLKCAGITKRQNGFTLHGFRHDWFQQMWRAAGFTVPLDGPALPQQTTVPQLGLQVVTKHLAIESAGHSDANKCGAYLGGHYKQLQAAGVSKQKIARANRLIEDLPYGDVPALERRKADLLAVQSGAMTLKALEDQILENYLQGTQHRRLMSRELGFAAPQRAR